MSRGERCEGSPPYKERIRAWGRKVGWPPLPNERFERRSRPVHGRGKSTRSPKVARRMKGEEIGGRKGPSVFKIGSVGAYSEEVSKKMDPRIRKKDP